MPSYLTPKATYGETQGLKDALENDIRKAVIFNWRNVAQDRDGWRRKTRNELILLG